MSFFAAPDGTRLSFRTSGTGPPLLCLAGGPGADVRDLGDLGGLERTLFLLDARACGRSEVPADRASCSFTAQALDVEALRVHLGLDRVDVLAHSAGTLTAQEFAARFPARLGALVLVTPAGRVTREPDEAEVAAIRANQSAPYRYGRWTEATRRHYERAYPPPPPWLREAFYLGSAAGVEVPGRLARLAAVESPVLAVAGEVDGIVGTRTARLVADVYPRGRWEVLPGCGHWPWLDDAAGFRELVGGFLAE